MKLNKLKPIFYSLMAKIFHPILKRLDNVQIKKNKKDSKFFPIYIIGAPRTGSTIFYQFFTNYFKVLFTDNIINHFYRTFYFAFQLSNFLFKNKAHNCYTSTFGRTYHCGMHGPSETSGFWYRWFPKDRHFLGINDIKEEAINDMKDNILSVSTKYNQHIVFKNLNNGQRIDILKKVHPNSKFLFIKRDPYFTVQSILNARKKNNIPKGEIWSVKPENYKELETLDEIEMVVRQVNELEKEIESKLKKMPAKQFSIIDYGDFCLDPLTTLNKINFECFDNKLKKRKSIKSISKINLSKKINISETKQNKIEYYLKQL